MKIRGWTIDGFGVFHNYEVRDLPDGLTVFHGANEAGKSTLLAFVRGMLFGFPDRRGGQARYQPLGGGRHGGRLIVDVGGDRSLIVDRDASRKSAVHVGCSDGGSASPADLEQALAGADEQLFRSVFAFSLTELQSFDSLTVDGIRDRIFTAGIAGAGRSARAVIGTLEDRSRTLLRRSKGARILVLATELDRVRDALDGARIAAVQYRDRLDEEARGEQETRALADALGQARAEHERHAALIDVWPAWCGLRAARAARAALMPIATLPADAEVRLATLSELLRAARRSADAVAAELDGDRQEHDRLERAGDELAALQEIEALHLELPLRRDRLRALDAARERLAVADADVAARIAQLGPGWDESRFATFAAQQPAVDEVRFWEQQLAAAAAAGDRAAFEHQRAERRLEDLAGERARVRARLPAQAPPALALLDERDGAIRRLRSHIVELRAVQSDAEASDRVVSDATQALRAFEAASVRIRPRWIAAILLLALLAGAGGAAWRESLGDRPGALLVGGVTLIVALGLGLLRRWAGQRERQRRDHVGALVAEIDEAQQARDAYRTRAAALRAGINVDRDALELATLSYDLLDEEDARLQRQRAERARWEEISAHIAQLDVAADAAQRVVQATADQRAVAERAWADALDGWHGWLRPCGLGDAGSPSEVMALLGGIDTCREVWTQRAEARRRVAELEGDIAQWEERACALIRRAEPDAVDDSGEACLQRVAALHERWCVERARREAQRRLAREIEEGTLRLEALERDCARIDAERAGLLRECSAVDEDDLRRQVAVSRQAADLDRTIAEGERQIEARVGAARAAAVRDELATGALETWEARRAAGAADIAAIEAQRDDAVRRHHDARRVRRELEDSAAVATLEAEYEGLRAELDAAVDEWRVTTAARALIEETLREFERSRQPAVLAEAGKVLATVTQGRYRGVLQDDEQIVVLDQGGGRKAPGELSRGTVEQLYLCVRLGLAAELGRRSAYLPLVMDDVLVNFDPERARAVAAALAEFADTHQILFFTCQPAIRDLLVSVGRAARVVEMTPAVTGSSNGVGAVGDAHPTGSRPGL